MRHTRIRLGLLASVALTAVSLAAVLLAVLLAVGRSFSIEEANRARDGLRLSGLDGGSIFVLDNGSFDGWDGKPGAPRIQEFIKRLGELVH